MREILAFVLFAALTPALVTSAHAQQASSQQESRINLLCQNWLHSSEEEKRGQAVEIYRPVNYKQFPASRFRMAYQFLPNGEYRWLYLSPDDAHRFKPGKWRVEVKKKTLLHLTTETGTTTYEILALTKDLLKLAPLKPNL